MASALELSHPHPINITRVQPVLETLSGFTMIGSERQKEAVTKKARVRVSG